MVTYRSFRVLAGVNAGVAILLAGASGSAQAAPGEVADFQRVVADAALEFQVPEEVLLGVSYQASWWEGNGGRPSTLGGYGPMHLTDTTAGKAYANRAGEGPVDSTGTEDPSEHTLNTAAELIHVRPDRVRTDEKENIRAGAALLASYQKDVSGTRSKEPGRWYTAVARYSQAGDQANATAYADAVYTSIRTGLGHTRKDGQHIVLTADPAVTPDKGQLPKLRLRRGVPLPAQAECPQSLNCRFVPAAANNYQVASRPGNKIKINTIVIHDIEGSYQAGISTFQNPSSGVSAHYVMKSDGSETTQMVANKDIAFHAGNYWVNMHAVGIEHEGFAAQGAAWFTPATYESTAKLVRYLAAEFDVPLDRQHIIGHDNVLTAKAAGIPGAHWDPGPYWDWKKFMILLASRGKEGGHEGEHRHGMVRTGQAVTIAPGFRHNIQTVEVCSTMPAAGGAGRSTAGGGAGTGCTAQTEPSNFLFMRTAPRHDAPLFADPAIHSDGSPGSDRIDDWGNTVVAGQQFVVADQKGEWTAIWYTGKKAWFHNPHGHNTKPALHARIIRPRTGPATVPLYSTAYPQPDEYPSGLSPSAQTPLGIYTFPQGQAYVATAPPQHTDDFFKATPTRPETVVTGRDTYDVIQYNHRLALVNHKDTLPLHGQGGEEGARLLAPKAWGMSDFRFSPAASLCSSVSATAHFSGCGGW
ncbi:N-acetylmuramoyl-L-alanine amidase [Streptomyces sp. NPDC006487]|uniref:N-acetylmuramoyl-L-alanine amidase n=1 Tax=Streptomyces sp. NPDC006487 TaxID=3364748 RepID=UPI0036C99A96